MAIDDEWKTLKRYWLDAHPESWTSVSFLIDRSGTVRFAHLGGEYAKGSADDVQMRAWIEELLAEEPGGQGTGGVATLQPGDIKRLAQSFEDALVKDAQDRNGPTVKPLLDTFVPELTKFCQRPVLASTRSLAVRLLADTHDARAIPCLKLTLESYAPDTNEDDVGFVARALAQTKFVELADGALHVSLSLEFSRPRAKLIGKDVASALLHVVQERHEEQLLDALRRTSKEDSPEATLNDLFRRTVAARALGELRSADAVWPLLKVLRSDEDRGGAMAVTALVAMVKIGRPSVDAAGSALANARVDDVGTLAQVLGALGDATSRAHLLAAYARNKDPLTGVMIALSMTQVPRSEEVVAAYQKTYEAASLDLEMPAGQAKELLAEKAPDLFDARVVQWLVKSSVKLTGSAEDVQAIRAHALLAAVKVMKAEQVALVETLFALTDKAFAEEFELSKEILKSCKSSVDCYVDALGRVENQTAKRQFVAIKAAFMVGVLGTRADSAKLEAALPKITNAAVRVVTLRALEALLPDGDAAVAARLDALYDAAERSKDVDVGLRIYPQVAARLRVRVP